MMQEVALALCGHAQGASHALHHCRARWKPTSLSIAFFDTSEVTISRSKMEKSRRAAAALDGMKRSPSVTRAFGDHNGLLLPAASWPRTSFSGELGGGRPVSPSNKPPPAAPELEGPAAARPVGSGSILCAS